MKNILITLMILGGGNLFFSDVSAEKLFNVVTSDPSEDKRAVAFVDTVTDKDRIVEVNMSGEVVWEWEFPIELKGKRKKSICAAADINYIKARDELLFVVPQKGAYIVNRKGKYKTVIEDSEITHDIDQLPNGNFIYTRGFVNKGDDEVREVTPTGKIVWKWSHADYFPDRDKYLTNVPEGMKDNWRGRHRVLRTDGIDWAHVNAVERYKNGDTLISLRNFLMFVIVDPKGYPKKLHKDIWLVHEPHKTNFGFIASDRFSGRGAVQFSIVKILKNGKREDLLTRDFFAVRGIEVLPSGRFNITSVGNVFEMDAAGKIVRRMHLTIQDEDSENNLGADKRPGRVLVEGRCAPKNLYKVVKTKIY